MRKPKQKVKAEYFKILKNRRTRKKTYKGIKPEGHQREALSSRSKAKIQVIKVRTHESKWVERSRHMVITQEPSSPQIIYISHYELIW